jgi:long-chain acyl-CoA synthetase
MVKPELVIMRVHHFLERSAERFPAKTALVCGEKRWTYEEIDRASGDLASSLAALGIQPGDRVALFLDNSYESVVSIFGILKAGAVFMVLNPTMRAGKLNFILGHSGARAVITETSKTLTLRSAIGRLPRLAHIILCHGGRAAQGNLRLSPATNSKTIVPWRLLVENGGMPLPAPGGSDDDLAALIYTSGSTGEPKGVMSAHRSMSAAVDSITTYLENVADDIILDVLPLSFDYGLYQVLMAFSFGGTVVLEKSFAYPYRILERLAEERVTGFPIVPSMAAILLRMETLEHAEFPALRYITNTAAAFPVDHIRKFRAVFPRVKIYSMYGLTECKRVSYLPPEELDRRPGSVGIPMPNTHVRIVGDDGRELGPDEVGELVIDGPNVMQGYWNAPEETARTFRPGAHAGETLLYSGDLFRTDRDGYLYFVGRKDDLIKSMGERVSPREVENVLCALPAVSEAAVIGVPDEIAGRAVKAFIVVADGAQLSRDDVTRHCRNHLEPFMIPKYVEFVASLPTSPHGKIDKQALGHMNERSGTGSPEEDS